MKRKKDRKLGKREKEEILLLEDLTPRRDVSGGAAKIPFGQPPGLPGETPRERKR